MTDISAVEEALFECDRFKQRAQKALESLLKGEDNNSYTAAMKRASQDLSNALVAVRGNHKEAREKPLSKAAKSPDIPPIKSSSKEFTKSLPQRTCFKCGQKFHSENPCRWKGEIHCDDCYYVVSHDPIEEEAKGGTQPDSDQYHCQECGLLYTKKDWCMEYGTCKKCAEHLDFKELGEITTRAKEIDSAVQSIEHKPAANPKTATEWKSTPGTSNGSYRCLEDEMVELVYGTCSPVKLSWVEIWSMAESNGGLAKEIRSLLGSTSNSNKVTAIRSFVKAVRAGQIPEAQGGDE